MAEHQCLHLCRPDLEAAGIDHAFEAVGDEEIAIFIHAPQVTRAEKAFAIQLHKHRAGGGLVAPVTAEHLGATDHDFALLAHGQLLQRIGVDHTRVGADEGNAQALLLGIFWGVVVRRGGGFRQPIAFLIAQAIGLIQTLGHRLRHGRTAAADIGQAAEVKLLEVRAGKQVNHHGGNVRPVRDLVLRDQTPCQLTIPARHQHHGGAHVNAAVHYRHHARDVEHGNHRQRDVLAGGTAPHGRGYGVEHDAGMRVHAAFGQARGAAGVGQYTQILRPHRQRRRGSGAGQRLLPAHDLACVQGQRWALHGQPRLPHLRHKLALVFRRQVFAHLCHHYLLQALARRQGIAGFDQLCAQVCRGDGHLDIAIGDVVLQLLRQIHRVHRHHHRIRPQDGKVRHHQLGQVLHQQNHPIALAHARCMQVRSQPLSALRQLTVAGDIAKKQQGRFVRVAARTGL